MPNIKLVGLPTNHIIDRTYGRPGTTDGAPTFTERVRYAERVLDSCQVAGATVMPVLIPSMGEKILPILEKIDGLIFTGSPSNVHPDHYGGHEPREDNVEDRIRDDTTLSLIKEAVKRKLPMLCICRGAQELNVALGGTLHQHIEELPDKFDHRYQFVDGQDYGYGFRAIHDMTIQSGGVLEKLYSTIDPNKKTWRINSAHAQGVDKLANGLKVEAVADDGVIEAFSYPGYESFLLGIQWHPEHELVINEPHNKILFQEFARHL